MIELLDSHQPITLGTDKAYDIATFGRSARVAHDAPCRPKKPQTGARVSMAVPPGAPALTSAFVSASGPARFLPGPDLRQSAQNPPPRDATCGLDLHTDRSCLPSGQPCQNSWRRDKCARCGANGRRKGRVGAHHSRERGSASPCIATTGHNARHARPISAAYQSVFGTNQKPACSMAPPAPSHGFAGITPRNRLTPTIDQPPKAG